ncbi:LytR family transcriptional regulator, partial [Streptomyces broussonetiae]
TIPVKQVQFLTVPRESYVYDANRDQLVEPEAEKLFARLRADQPVAVTKNAPGTGPTAPRPKGDDTADGEDGRAGKGVPSPAPTFRGSTAAEHGCA